MAETSDTTPVVEYRCTLKDVADQIPARTRDVGGNLVGTFTSATQPTDEQVNRVIDGSLGEVAMTIGYKVPESCAVGARRLVALHAAREISGGRFPEQANATLSEWDRLDRLYVRLLPLVRQCVADGGAGGPDTDIATADETGPMWSFPQGSEVAEGAERGITPFPDPRQW